jgi:hypothetical protein
MASRKGSKNKIIKVILDDDSAIPESVTPEIYEEYTVTLDEAVLQLEGEPTRYVLKTDLEFHIHKELESEKLGITSDGQPAIRLGYILEEVRATLIDIENPIGEEPDTLFIFKKEKKDGRASKELIAELHSCGQKVQKLFNLRQKHTSAVPQKKISLHS